MHSPQCLCLAFQLVTIFLSNSLKALVTRTVINGFPSVTSELQHLVFKKFFHDVLFTAPSPSPGGDEKVILIFQRNPINYSTGLCVAYSLHIPFFKFFEPYFQWLLKQYMLTKIIWTTHKNMKDSNSLEFQPPMYLYVLTCIYMFTSTLCIRVTSSYQYRNECSFIFCVQSCAHKTMAL